jgi:hypothetical protein
MTRLPIYPHDHTPSEPIKGAHVAHGPASNWTFRQERNPYPDNVQYNLPVSTLVRAR